MSKETEDAYRDTNYVVPLPDKHILLRVDEASEEIKQLMSSATAQGAVFMTAHNPFGEFLTGDENTAANMVLQTDLEASFPNVLPCYGVSHDEVFREESFLVFPIDRAAAIELCCRYDQNAVLFIGEEGVPELLLHPELCVESMALGI